MIQKGKFNLMLRFSLLILCSMVPVVFADPDGSPSASKIPVSNGLIIDLDANLGVQLEEENRVSVWINQVPGSALDKFVKRDEGRKEAGSGRPTLLEKVKSINGNNTILFNRQELVNMNDDSMDHLLLGNGYTWICVMSIHDQKGGKKDVNAFFGNLRNSAPYDGIMASFNDDNTIWAHSRSTNLVKEGKRYPKFKEFVRPELITPDPIEEDRYYIIMGRMGAGEGKVDLDIFINSSDPIVTAPYIVTQETNSSRLAIGQERDAITHPGAESFHGEITRLLFYERPLSKDELESSLKFLTKEYLIQQ